MTTCIKCGKSGAVYWWPLSDKVMAKVREGTKLKAGDDIKGPLSKRHCRSCWDNETKELA